MPPSDPPTNSRTKTKRILDRARQQGVVRACDLEDDLPARSLRRLAERGDLERVGRGLYRHPDAPVTEHHSLALVGARYPTVRICLLSALQFYDLTTQWPRKVWIARETSAWTPTASPVELEVVRMSGASFTDGTQTYKVEGIPIQVFGPAKTVADCFKFRSKVGKDTAIEALRSYVRSGVGPVEDLYRYAEVCRVRTIMRPFIEATL